MVIRLLILSLSLVLRHQTQQLALTNFQRTIIQIRTIHYGSAGWLSADKPINPTNPLWQTYKSLIGATLGGLGLIGNQICQLQNRSIVGIISHSFLQASKLLTQILIISLLNINTNSYLIKYKLFFLFLKYYW